MEEEENIKAISDWLEEHQGVEYSGIDTQVFQNLYMEYLQKYPNLKEFLDGE